MNDARGRQQAVGGTTKVGVWEAPSPDLGTRVTVHDIKVSPIGKAPDLLFKHQLLFLVQVLRMHET